MSETTEERALVERYGAAWSAGDIDAIMSMHTDDTIYVLHGRMDEAVGRDAVRDAFIEALRGWQALDFELVDVQAGQALVVFQSRVRGTTKTGIEIMFEAIDCMTTRDGKIVRKDSYFVPVSKAA